MTGLTVAAPGSGHVDFAPATIENPRAPRVGKMRVTLIDNYDSFTFNLVHYLGSLGADVSVWRNDTRTPTGDRRR